MGDFSNLDLIGYVCIALLPLLGFYVGARWAQQQNRLKDAERRADRADIPRPGDSGDYRLQASLDAINQQLAELAERQNFTERILAQQAAAERERALLPGPQSAATPV